MINTVDLESIKKIITDSSYYTMMSNPATFVSSLSKLKKLNMDLVIIYNNFSINGNHYYNHKFEVLKTCLIATFAFSSIKITGILPFPSLCLDFVVGKNTMFLLVDTNIDYANDVINNYIDKLKRLDKLGIFSMAILDFDVLSPANKPYLNSNLYQQSDDWIIPYFFVDYFKSLKNWTGLYVRWFLGIYGIVFCSVNLVKVYG